MHPRRTADAALALVVLPVLLLLLNACGDQLGSASETDSSSDSSVITFTEPADDYPLAEVQGKLALRDGCLLLGDEIVFWPHGATWDDASQAVVFENAPPAQTGTTFDGGGGHYDNDTDFTGWLGAEFGDAISECQDKTDAVGVLFAYATLDDMS